MRIFRYLGLSTYHMETIIAMTDETIQSTNDNPSLPMFKHIVLSGGGPSIFTIFGALKHMFLSGYIQLSKIESIHACSSGAFLGVCLCMLKQGLTIDELESYLVERCWKTLFVSEVLDFKTAFEAKGLFDSSVIKKAISPLLVTVGLSSTATLMDLYDACGINLVMYAVDINSKPLEKVVISKDTFQDTHIFEALAMTMGLPGVVTPTFIDSMCLVDGGLMANYPYLESISDSGDDGNSTIGFKIKWEKPRQPIDSSSNIISFLAHLMKMMAMHIDTSSRDIPETSNTVECCAPDAGNPAAWVDLFGDNELRKTYVKSGEQSAMRFIEEKTPQTQPECHT